MVKEECLFFSPNDFSRGYFKELQKYSEGEGYYFVDLKTCFNGISSFTIDGRMKLMPMQNKKLSFGEDYPITALVAPDGNFENSHIKELGTINRVTKEHMAEMMY